MVMNLLTNYNFTILISKLTDVTALIVELVVIMASLVGAYNTKRNIFKILSMGAILLLVVNIVLDWHGGFSERVIDEYGGKLYVGQVENGQANGWGRLFDEDRNIEYIGEFKNNKYDGEGRLYSVINESDTEEVYCEYEGGFSEGKCSGYGKCYIYNKGEALICYDGNYLENKKCGQGTLYLYDENNSVIKKYSGGFAYGKPYGYGVYEVYEKGFKYEGTFIDGCYGGEGKSYRNGELEYDGQWENNKYNGYGISFFYDDNGERKYYKGEFLNGYMHGYGSIYNMSNEIEQTGYYENGMKIDEELDG